MAAAAAEAAKQVLKEARRRAALKEKLRIRGHKFPHEGRLRPRQRSGYKTRWIGASQWTARNFKLKLHAVQSSSDRYCMSSTPPPWSLKNHDVIIVQYRMSIYIYCNK